MCGAMVDVFTKEKRSWVMSRIKGKGTKIEKLFERELRKNKIKFKKYPKILKKGNPDFLIWKVAIFIDGCFWHGCPKHYRSPKSKKGYWIPKIEDNMKRDIEVNKNLRKMGYKVVRFWEHDARRNPDKLVNRVRKYVETVETA